MSQMMQRDSDSQHPALDIGAVSTPRPILALLLLTAPYIVRLHNVRRYVRSLSEVGRENGLSAIHLLLYTRHVSLILPRTTQSRI